MHDSAGQSKVAWLRGVDGQVPPGQFADDVQGFPFCEPPTQKSTLMENDVMPFVIVDAFGQ
jgi:hypothetical protein